jgi:hypothetical protein
MASHYLYVPSHHKGPITQRDLNRSGMPCLFGLSQELQGANFHNFAFWLRRSNLMYSSSKPGNLHFLQWIFDKQFIISTTFLRPYLSFVLHWQLDLPIWCQLSDVQDYNVSVSSTIYYSCVHRTAIRQAGTSLTSRRDRASLQLKISCGFSVTLSNSDKYDAVPNLIGVFKEWSSGCGSRCGASASF